MTSLSALHRILSENKSVAVVGLSAGVRRPSYFAAKYLLERGYRVIPVNPRYEEVLGQKCYPCLEDIPERVDIVDCFRPADAIPPLTRSAIDIKAKVLWMQLGVINEEAANLARQAGLEVVMDRCMKIEYARLFGGLGWMGVNTGIISSKRPRHVVH